MTDTLGALLRHLLQHAAWGWLLAALPPLLVLHHAIYLARIKPRYIDREKMQRTQEGMPAALRHQFDEVVATSDRYFASSGIAARYGSPAVSLFLIALVVFYVLNPAFTDTYAAGLKDSISALRIEAAQFGAVGAYAYVLLYLSQRGFRHDISTGAAFWCAVTLALGPLLAAVASKIWMPSVGAGANPETPGMAQAIYFFAGFSPRALAEAIEQLARKFFAGEGATQRPARSVPLTELAGIATPVAERLIEEGIYDVAALAQADVLRLQRSTAFDKRQILDWIDQALLYRTLPDAFEGLQKNGITGAIDLAWYWSKELTVERVTPLAKTVQLEPELLADVVRRLYEDSQVKQLWMLHQLETGDVSTETPTQMMPTGPARVDGPPSEPKVPEPNGLIAPPPQNAIAASAQGIQQLPLTEALPPQSKPPEQTPKV